jgi:hypothetical protein
MAVVVVSRRWVFFGREAGMRGFVILLAKSGEAVP